jgi:hypothetical protein
MKTKALIVCLFLTFSLFAQKQINQHDANGKKHGVWIVWLDTDWKLAKDSMSAAYYRFNYFDRGASVYGMGPWGGKNTKLEGIPNKIVKKGNAKQLDGVYKWYNSKGQLICEHVLKDGWYVSFKEYYPSTGQLQTFFDYNKKFEDKEYTWWYGTYDKSGKLTFEGWECEQNGKRPGTKGVDN